MKDPQLLLDQVVELYDGLGQYRQLLILKEYQAAEPLRTELTVLWGMIREDVVALGVPTQWSGSGRVFPIFEGALSRFRTLTRSVFFQSIDHARTSLEIAQGKLRWMVQQGLTLDQETQQAHIGDIGDTYQVALIPPDIVYQTRGYIENIVTQANGCYQAGWYDACAVMIRRLIETLIIECFERHGIENKIKDKDGNYFHLSRLVPQFIEETKWNIGRNTKSSLPKLKGIGDLSAHNRRYLARRHDIESLASDMRIAVEELIHIAEFNSKSAASG
jgi:hypothetical protein